MNEGIRIKSSIESLRSLINEVKEGRFRLPAFQRSFTWRNDQIADLFDSVARDYPIGSLYVWSTTGDHISSDGIGPFTLPPRKPGSLVNLVIDGNHRIATLAGVLLADDKAEEQWKLFYDPDAERFCHMPAGRSSGEAHWVPVKSLTNMLEVLAESRRLMSINANKAHIWLQRVERVARSITEYHIPVISYTGDLGSAIEVFARLNQKGNVADADELLTALSSRGEAFRLNEQIDLLVEEVAATGFGRINRTLVLWTILAIADLDIRPHDWSRLQEYLHPPGRFIVDVVQQTRRGLLSSVAFLQTQGIHCKSQLPYGMQLVALSTYLGRSTQPSSIQQSTLARMLWVTSFSAWFGSPTRERKLIRTLSSLAFKDMDFDTIKDLDLSAPALPMPSNMEQRSARVRALASVLVAQAPRRIDGSPLGVEIGPLLLNQEANPLARIFSHGPKELLASPANFVIAVQDKVGEARSWLRNIPAAHQDVVLRSLSIPPESFPFLEANEPEKFLQARLAYLDQLEREFMRSKGVTEPEAGAKPAPSPIDTDD